MTRTSWSEYFLDIAEAVSRRADCRRAQHGAVIVDTDHRIVSTGYNGVPAGDARSCTLGDCPRGLLSDKECAPLSPYENCISLHAEMNAIAYGSFERMKGGTIYITGKPCTMCRKLIDAAGIGAVFYRLGGS